MEIVFSVIVFLFGISIGSFLNVVADRVPAGQSILSPPSHCSKCNHVLKPVDLFPVLSYLILKGKCRYCRESIPIHSLLVELFSGLFFAWAFIMYGISWQALQTAVLVSFLIILFITDMEQEMLPHVIVYPGIAAALCFAALQPITGNTPNLMSASAGFATGFGAFSLIWAIPKLFKSKLIGFGDVGMAGLIGASVGYPVVLVALYIAILAGGLTAALLVAFKMKKLNQPMRLGAFLAMGGIISLFCGQDIADALMQLHML
ncbi:MAG: prepilin peptidase [Dehalococcoidia bacterium]|nr:prepilin peptidase [Dehalococcoidia bacterium]